MVEPPVFYLESTVPTTACEMAVVIRSISCAYFTYRILSFWYGLPPALLLPPPTSVEGQARGRRRDSSKEQQQQQQQQQQQTKPKPLGGCGAHICICQGTAPPNKSVPLARGERDFSWFYIRLLIYHLPTIRPRTILSTINGNRGVGNKLTPN
jgi:hypothetical protein